ncbi:MAG: glycosyltransferase family 39 protein, partial [Coprothermobacterota bacterium]|nr:glycosyltransferase family 39 protein [Coprothermobacterota bacterium]
MSPFEVPPVFFFVAYPFAKLFGVMLGVKIATALFTVLLGLATYLLVRTAFRSDLAALLAVVLVVFSPMTLRVAVDIRKNMASLALLVLFLYLFLRCLKNWRWVFLLAAVGLLGIFTHKTFVYVWFILPAYLPFSWLIERRRPDRQDWLLLGCNVVAVVGALLLWNSLSSGFNEIVANTGLPFQASRGAVPELWPLLVVAVPGGLLATLRPRRETTLLLTWFTLSLLLTFPQVNVANQWRFQVMLFPPAAVFAAVSWGWLWRRFRIVSLPVLLTVLVLSVVSFVGFGSNDLQMKPSLPEPVLDSLERGSQVTSRQGLILTDLANQSGYWVRYFYGPGMVSLSFPDRAQTTGLVEQALSAGQPVYLVLAGNPQTSSPQPSPTSPPPLRFDQMVRLYVDRYVAIWQVKSARAVPFPREPAPFDENGGKGRELSGTDGYQAGRWAALSTFLIAPYEALRAINPPFLALWEIQIGFPACLLLLGVLFLGCQEIYPWLSRRPWLLYLLLFASMSCVATLYLFSPAWFWGGSVPPVDPTSMRPPEL